MKSIFFNIIFAFLLVVGLSSCSDFLDTFPSDKYDDAAVWQSEALVQSYLFTTYTRVPYPFQWYLAGSLVDESLPSQEDGLMMDVLRGNMSPDRTHAFVNNWGYAMHNWWWPNVFNAIRRCNLFFEKIDEVPFEDETKKLQFTGEVHFLRAYFYHLLLVQYGGVPVFDRVFHVGDDYRVPRNTLAETVDFIVKDLDEAARILKETGQSDKTRGSEGAALALKSRVLLYAASDLFNSRASWWPGYSNPELVSYMDDNRRQRWEAAQRAAKEVMDLGIYELYDVNPANNYLYPNSKAKNFADLFLQISSREQIFITQYDKQNDPVFYGSDQLTIYGRQADGFRTLSQPIGNLANAFENSDGSYFDFEAKKDDPYVGRDPRFYASILYNGANWVSFRGAANPPTSLPVQNGYWTRNADGETVARILGRDHTHVGRPTYTYSGYIMRKFINPELPLGYYFPKQPQPYMQIRYAEIILNYAEACIGVGDEPEARRALNMIRDRAGMPDVPETETGADLIKRLRNERQVELAFEVHRIWDVRRWMIGPEAYIPARGVDVHYQGNHPDDTNPVYTEAPSIEARSWNPSHYLVPIQRAELERNTALIQNPGYTQ